MKAATRIEGRGARTRPERPVERSEYGPWEVVSKLGEGAMGVVHRVVHRETGAEAALKTVPAADPLLLASLRREVRALSRLTHPGIVRILDAHLVDAEPWYAMELLEGSSLRTLLLAGIGQSGEVDRSGMILERSRLERPAPPAAERDRLLRVFPAVCDALAFLHGEGVVHLDLKPDNVFMAGERPVLMDFGLAARAIAAHGREPLEVVGRGFGTLAYIAPEQIRGELVDARADIYALGCMLYEVIAGRPPFLGDRGAAILFGHLEREPAPLSRFAPDVPPAIEALVHAMLAKAPRDRPGYATDIARELRRALGEASPPADGSPRPRDYLYRPELVGRAEVLAELTRELELAEEGDARVVLLGGESGVGKTRLAVELAQREAHGRFDVLVGECSPLSVGDARGAPLAPLADVFATIADRCREHERGPERELLRSHGAPLAPYAPALRALPDAILWEEAEPLTARAARARLVRSVCAVLEALAATRPILLLVDDVHWADDLTIEVLESIASGTWITGGILVLATYRQGELGLALGELREAGAVKDIQVGRLDRESARAMAFGIVGGAELPEAMVEQVTDHGEGNPFFIAEYLRAAVREGVLRRSEGRWQAHDPDGARIAALPMPPSIRELVEARFERLGPSAQSMAELAAVIGRRIDPTVALAAFEGSEADALDAINELLRTQMVENGTDGALHFAHAKLHEATYERIDLERRTALHTAVARALEPLDDWTGKDAELAHHYLEAGIFEPAIEHLEQAGLRALGSGSYGAALSYFEWAIGAADTQSLDVPIVRRARWERCLGDGRYALGDLGGAMSHARHALELLGHPLPPTGKGAVRALAREVYARMSRQHADPSALEEAALAAVRVGECAYFTLELGPLVGGSWLATSLAARAGADAKVAKAYAMLGLVVGAMRARGPSLRLFERALDASSRSGDIAGRCFSMIARATADLSFGDLESARPLSASALELAQRARDPHSIGMADTLLGHCEYWTGDLSASAARFARLAESARETKVAQHEAWGLYAEARSLVHMGDCARAIELCVQARERLVGQNDAASALIADALYAWALLGEGKLAPAREAAAELVVRMRKPTTLFATIPAYAAACETWLELAERGDRSAIDHASSAARALSGLALGTPLAAPTAALYGGRVALARGARRRARRQLERAVAIASKRGMSLDELLARAALARCVDGERARVERAHALAIAERIGARRHLSNIDP